MQSDWVFAAARDPHRFETDAMIKTRIAKYQIGDVVKHRHFPFRGVIFDVDPSFSNSEEWYQAIPEQMRPSKDQPFYHLFAENADSEYVAYVSEQNLLPDESGLPIRHPEVEDRLDRTDEGSWRLPPESLN
jgi:heat shock protein HspQ